MEALVIVHLSSLDSYAAQSREASGSWVYAEELTEELKRAIRKHVGPIIVVDQRWRLGRRESDYRLELLALLGRKKNVTWIEFDENVDSWPRFLGELRALLKKKGVTGVLLGGVWGDGCVQGVLKDLENYTDLPVKVGEWITGFERDYEHEWLE